MPWAQNATYLLPRTTSASSAYQAQKAPLEAQVKLMLRNASSTIANTTSRHSRTYSSIPCPTHRRGTTQYCYGQRRGLITPPSSSGASLSRTSAGDSASANLEPKSTDPRPQWLFTTSSLLRMLVVPGEHLTSVNIFVFKSS